MTLPTLLFAHANGFPAGSYRRFFEGLGSRYRVLAPEQMGHDPAYPVRDGWRELADELNAWAAPRASEPVIGVGHSLGGIVTLLAALRRPARFRCVVLMDPPLVFGWNGLVMRAAKRFGFIDRLTPAGRSLGRRSHWPDRETAMSALREKPLFRRFDPDCLRDYVNAATRDADGGVRLTFDPAVEVDIFRTLPDDLYWKRGRLQVPGAALVARDSNVTRSPDLRRLVRRHGLTVEQVPGGHLFPMESPALAAEAVNRVIRGLLGRAR